MKAGLLLCDHINDKYKKEFGDYDHFFAKLFPEFDFVFYDVCNGRFPENIDECDFYLTTGSKYSTYENIDWMLKMKTLVQTFYQKEKCFIGCCFGHQLMAEALGGKVQKSDKGWCVGVHQFEIKAQENWMIPFQSELNLLMMCQDQVLELPKDSKVLAGNEKCPNGIIQIGKRMLGIQGHPEFSKSYDELLIKDRVERIGEEDVKIGLDSLYKEVHQKTIHDWIINFIKAGR